ncbi:amino acid adenylation domain-containing protein [Wukongibacter sp. M2B1]|uniref:non-ribosomal peptide synthetase n=1 Tax=Wukongibacter sp. M2B1 TaxID=3088895 RepID=UPI003D7A93D4|nr:NRPS [Wukongibacter baidiensis]
MSISKKLSFNEANIIVEQLEKKCNVSEIAMVIEKDETINKLVHIDDLDLDYQAHEIISVEDYASIDIDSYSEMGNRKKALISGKPLLITGEDPKTLQEILKRAASLAKDKGIIFILEEGVEDFLSYQDLLSYSEQLLHGLRNKGIKPGESVILQFRHNRNFIIGFWACILGGFLPTPLAVAPSYRVDNAAVRKMHNTWKILDKPIILTEKDLKDEILEIKSVVNEDEIIAWDIETLLDNESDKDWFPCTEDTVVLNLLTSGSTGIPKCVQHKSGSVIARSKATAINNGFTSDEISLNWMPLDHVGGIVMSHIRDTFLMCNQINGLISEFIKNPLNWLDWIEKYRATYSWAPNFAFSLVVDCKEKMQGKKWDLSSMKCILNGGEAIVPRVAKDFLKILRQYKLDKKCMMPSFGMSETSSGILECKKYDVLSDNCGTLFVDKRTLNGQLRLTDKNSKYAVVFTEVGSPVPGVRARIVDENNKCKDEDEIGLLQISGPTIMNGYFKNDIANKEAFTDDGWFNTGDLAFIHNGSVVITGREKDVIILNGANYYNYEIEAIAEQVKGVKTTFSCATSIRLGDGSEAFAIFYVPVIDDLKFNILTIQRIKQVVTEKIGVTPKIIIPVSENEFYKTDSGKISRAQFRKNFENNVYSHRIKEIDLYLENENTLPQWFYRETLFECPLDNRGDSLNNSKYLIFCNSYKMKERFISDNRFNKANLIFVSIGQDFECIDNNYSINPKRQEDYIKLFKALKEKEYDDFYVMHLWNCTQSEINCVEELRSIQYLGAISIMYIIQQILSTDIKLNGLTVATINSLGVDNERNFNYYQSTISGYVKSAAEENIKIKHIDLEGIDEDFDYELIIVESNNYDEKQVLYRNNKRFKIGIEKLDVLKNKERVVPLKEGGVYVITGGLGGVGSLIAKILMANYRANVVLLGRREIQFNSKDAIPHIHKPKIERYTELKGYEKYGGSVEYISCDICDLNEVHRILKECSTKFKRDVDGVIHFAGVIQEKLIVEQTEEELLDMYKAKVFATWVLNKALEKYEESIFISASSARTLLPGMTVSAYCSANDFIGNFAYYQNNNDKNRNYCFSWSLWDEIGMSEGLVVKNSLNNKGFSPINSMAGKNSFLAALRFDEPLIYIGLNDSKYDVCQLTNKKMKDSYKLSIYSSINHFLSKGYDDINQVMEEVKGTELKSLNNEVIILYELPVDKNGAINKSMLVNRKSTLLGKTDMIRPRTEEERIIHDIWKELLKINEFGVTDNFFQVGGDSIRAMRLLSALKNKFKKNIKHQELFKMNTIEQQAKFFKDTYQRNDKVESLENNERDLDVIKQDNELIAEMSSAQKSQWILYEMNPDCPYYNNTVSITITGFAIIPCLKMAINELVRRHDTLRTKYRIVNDIPSQIVFEDVDFEIEEYDLRELAVEEKKTKLEEIHYEEANKVINIVEDNPFRVKIIQLEALKTELLMSMHHIMSDGWSMRVLLQDITDIYKDILKYGRSRLPDLPMRYIDYSMDQKKYLLSKGFKNQLNYWKNQLHGELPILELPIDKQRPHVHTYNGKRRIFEINQNTTISLRNLCNEKGCTLYMLLMSAFACMLQRHTRQEDLIIGTLIANRNDSDLEKMIGFFANTMPLRLNVKPSMGFDALLEQVKDRILGLYDNQDVPFEVLVNELQIQREANRNPLFPVLFALQNAQLEAMKVDDTKFQLNIMDSDTSKFDFSVQIFEIENSLSVKFEYNTDLFKDETMERWQAHFIKLVEEIANKKYEMISEFEIIPENERELLLDKFNNTEAKYQSGMCIHQLIEEQVMRGPDKTAVAYGDEKITYKELNEKANRLASELHKEGIKAREYVAVVTERSIDMIVRTLAVMKVGAVCVPINTMYPVDRIYRMLKDCMAKAVLAQGNTDIDISGVKEASRQVGAKIIFTDTNEKCDGLAEDAKNLNISNDLAYLIYKTDEKEAKGVMLEHSSIVNMVKDVEYVNLKDIKLLQTGALSFERSIFEIWGALLNGGELHLIDGAEFSEPEELKDIIKKYEIDMMCLTPAIYNQMVIEDVEVFDGLKYLLIGGDRISKFHVGMLKKHNENIRIFNGYESTETTGFVTIYEIGKEDDIIPIGKPIRNNRIYILDGDNLCGIGITGEMYISGSGLSRGYLNKPELTAERFIENPVLEGEKLYKTGDLARWLDDGNIEYLGKINNQTQIRGLKVKLDEIEDIIKNQKGVEDAVVVSRKDEEGQNQLYAYMVLDGMINITRIMEELQKTLPEYMIPAYIAQIDWLPLTNKGKVDKGALPDIRESWKEEYIEPRDEKEEVVAKIFGEILGIDRIGIKDSFFERGGNSIRATRLVNHIEKLLGVRLSLQRIFETPTVEGICKQLSGEKSIKYEEIPRTEKKPYYVMSSAQKRMYLVNKIDRDGIAYNMPIIFETNGELDYHRIKAAFEKLIERHEILRTSFHMIDDEPMQKISDHVKLDIEYIEKDDYGKSDFVRPFDLGKAPLMRIRVVKKEDRVQLFFDMHHIISDGVSLNILIDEFSRLYNGETLEKLRIHYKDYSEWMMNRDLSKQREYWVKEFSGDTPILSLPLDYQRPKIQSFSGNVIREVIGKEIKQKIQSLSKANGTTEYMTLLSAVMILLQKYSRQEDIVVGSPITGRTHKDTETIMGMLVNTLAMRGRPEGEKSYRDFLAEIRASTLKAYDNQEYPFEELVESVEVVRDLSRNPLFDVMFALQNNEALQIHIEDMEFQLVPNQTVAHFDLNIFMQELGDSYEIFFEYCSELFKEETIKRMIGHFSQILEQITEFPDKKIKDIEVVKGLEKETVLYDFNDTKSEYPKDKSVHNLFEEQVMRIPEAVAVVFGDEEITYKGLNQRANQLARRLRKEGVRPNDCVGIMVEKSIEMIVGILGIIKAGGAYVPIDPMYPEARIGYMINDCEAKVMLTDGKGIEVLRRIEVSLVKQKDFKAINIFSKDVYKGLSTNVDNVNIPEDIGYIIYTSGTTGKPKGVMVEHKSINRLVKNTNYVNFNDVRILQTGALSFDASTFEIWGALLNGGRLYLAKRDAFMNADLLKEMINTYKINMMWLTAALYNQLITENVKTFNKLEYLLIGGEKLSAEHVKMLKETNKNTKLINGYGPTENTTFTTTYEIVDGNCMIPIGKPISNTRVYILNDNKLCGIGMPGELCVAGDGLAKGYLNQVELTKEKFVENPYVKGECIYRTGDMARWLPDGNIEYLGRIDEQVKIRGFRIELGEIESVLKKQAGILDTAVIVREDEAGDKVLYAYIVSKETMDINEIKESIRKELPSYMVPAFMMQIESLPVTKNGKLNKKALPEIEAVNEENFVAPRNEQEKALVSSFEEILGIEKVGIRDSFFELGGNSLRATRLVNHIEKSLGIRLSLQNIFANQTVEEICKQLNEDQTGEYEQIPRAEEKPYYTMSSAQKRIYLVNKIDKEGVAYNMPIVLEAKGDIDYDRVKYAFEKLVERHEILRTSFHMVDGHPVQRISQKVQLDIEYLEANEYTREEFVRPFDLAKAPLIRIKVVKLQDSVKLFLDMHHIISDGFSLNILVDEVSRLYNGEVLKPLSLQYKDYSQWMATRDLSKQEQYWINEFSGDIPVLSLPLDYQRPKIQSFSGNLIREVIGKEIKQKIQHLSKTSGTTEYMTLLSVVMILLQKYSKQEDIIVGSPISGRTHKDTESIMGMFVNTLAMRGRPEGEKSYRQFLAEIKESTLKAYDNQEYPFEELVESVDIARDLSRNPLFDVVFALQNNEATRVHIENLEFKLVPNQNITHFDLSIHIQEFEENYELFVEYCTDLFKAKTIKGMMEHFKNILEQITEYPDIKIKDIEMLSNSEKEMILSEFNNTDKECQKNMGIPELIEEQVKRIPNNTAVAYDGERITYQELNEKANRLALELRRKGIKQKEHVAVVTERSIDMIVRTLAVMKAGAVCVPVNPMYPVDRIYNMLKDCMAKAVLVQGNTDIDISGVKEASRQVGAKIIFTDTNEKCDGLAEDVENLNISNDLAYLIYKTDEKEAKGVILEHSSIVNMVKDVEYVNLKDIKLLQTGALSFERSIFEIWGALLNGGELHLIDGAEFSEPEELKDIIKKYEIDMMCLTPAIYNQMVIEDVEIFDGLKYLLIGGDRISKFHVGILKKHNENIRIFNGYESTETTGFVTIYEIGKEDDIIPIGKPIRNNRIYILDGDNLCGIGIPGEMYISGSGLSRGYLNKPELTAERFIENPVLEGEKLYKTGDLARWLDDGNIEYLGKIEDQVKIKGFKINSIRIEDVIKTVNGVQDAALVPKRDEKNQQQLYAYIALDEGVDVRRIIEELQIYLPEYMIPAYITQIDWLPLTNKGKVDKEALPDIVDSWKEEYIAPRNEKEEAVARIFGEILSIDVVGVKDSFFERGGNSIKATRLVNHIEEALGVRLSLKSIFANPTVEEICKQFSDEKTVQYEQIPRADKKNYYAMSSTQKRMFFINEMDRESTAYNMPIIYEAKGDIDFGCIKNAFEELVERHEILRTSFHMADGQPVQRISNEAELDIEYIESKGYTKADFLCPFDLRKAPLLRIRVVKEEEKNLIFFDMHHIISDGVSLNILIEEFLRLYSGQVLEPLNIQYKDYSEWMVGRDLEEQKKYWLDEFSTDIPILSLPLDYQRSKVQSFRGNMIEESVGKEIKEKIQHLSKVSETTEYMTLLSAVMILLRKYSRQEDIVIGSPITGRVHKDTEKIMGMFVNTLAMRGRPEGEKSYRDFLKEIKESTLKAYDNQEYPLEELVESVEVVRDLSRNPLFDVVFALQNIEDIQFKSEKLELEAIESEHITSHFDLSIYMKEIGDSYRVIFEYCSDLFKEETMQGMLKHFVVILEQIAENPDKKLKDIEAFTDLEKEKVLYDFNDTMAEYPRDKSVYNLFEEQVNRMPEAVAVVFGDKEITYGELDQRASQLARVLREEGVKPNDYIVIMVEKSIEMIIGILGIIKAGGAYVPIDPMYPDDRIRYMINDCEAKVILTEGQGIETMRRVEEGLKSQENIKVLNLFDKDVYRNLDTNVDNVNTPEDICYLMYTSGTTGKPKGVMVEHKSVNRLVKNTNYVDLNDVRILQTGALSFDASTFEIWGALLNGGRLYLAERDVFMNTNMLKEMINSCRINTMWLTAALYNQLITENANTFDKLRCLLIGGEKLSPKHVRKLKEVNQNIKLINGYGPTENTTFTTTYEIVDGNEMIPIGKPISNTKVYILNDKNLCGIGMPGELCIAGDGLARGYLNQPELTKEKFMENPCIEGERIYRTGDLARWMPDGNIEYLGRMDEQVKIRGFRIELNEVESVIKKQKGILDAAVIARENEAGDKALCGYIVAEEVVEIDEIKENIRKELPDYMIPALMMQLESLPVTKNGKLDKRALPEIDMVSKENYVAPKNEIEKAVVSSFKEILGIENIGVKDKFFELGGDSIKAIRVVSKIREEGYELSVKDLMTSGNIENISKKIEEISQESRDLYEQGEISGEVPLTPIQKTFNNWRLEKPNHFNQHMVLKNTHFDESALRKILDAMVSHHDILRAVYREGKQYILSIEESKGYDMSIYDLTDQLTYEIEDFVYDACNKLQESMDLHQGPLMKIGLFKTKKEDHLFICLHHLVVDGVSWRILLEDLEKGYGKAKGGDKIELPLKTASYKDWAYALEEYSQSKTLKNEYKYWLEVNEVIDKGNLKGDTDGEVTDNEKFGTEKFVLNKEKTKELLYEAGKAYGTEINDLLLTALGEAVRKSTKQTILSVALEGHGRESLEKPISIDRTVGWFTSIYPVIITTPNNDIEGNIIRVKEMLRRIPNKGIGYGILRSSSEYDLSDKKVSICFNYLGDFDHMLTNKGKGKLDKEDNIEMSEFSGGEANAKENGYDNDLTFNGNISNGQLNFIITYNVEKYSEKLIQKIKENYITSLTNIINHCIDQDDTVMTASDLGILDLKDKEIEEINKFVDFIS